MAEPIFLYRNQAETIVARLHEMTASGETLRTVQDMLVAGVANLSNPVRLILDPPQAAALEMALQKCLSAEDQALEPWRTILLRLAILRGQLPARHWRSR